MARCLGLSKVIFQGGLVDKERIGPVWDIKQVMVRYVGGQRMDRPAGGAGRDVGRKGLRARRTTSQGRLEAGRQTERRSAFEDEGEHGQLL